MKTHWALVTGNKWLWSYPRLKLFHGFRYCRLGKSQASHTNSTAFTPYHKARSLSQRFHWILWLQIGLIISRNGIRPTKRVEWLQSISSPSLQLSNKHSSKVSQSCLNSSFHMVCLRLVPPSLLLKDLAMRLTSSAATLGSRKEQTRDSQSWFRHSGCLCRP